MILSICRSFAQESDDVPKLCHAIEKYLSEHKSSSSLLAADKFTKWVADKVGIALSDDEKKVAVEYLDSSGTVSYHYL